MGNPSPLHVPSCYSPRSPHVAEFPNPFVFQFSPLG